MTQLGAAAALACLTQSEALTAAVVREGALPALARLLHNSGNAGVLKSVTAALAYILRHSPGSADEVVATGCIPCFVRQLRTSAPGQGLAAEALCRLVEASGSSAAAAIEAAGGRVALQQHTDSSDLSMGATARKALELLDSHASQPAASPAVAAPRVCAAEGCGATTGLRRCGGCGRVRYCSVECSKAHWFAHRADCKRWRAEVAAAAASGETGGSTGVDAS